MPRKSSFTQEEKDIIYKMYVEDKVGCTTISRVIHKNECTIASYIAKNIGCRTRSEAARKYSCNSDFFETIDTEEKAYWLGFMYADGYVSSAGVYNHGTVGISLNLCDYEHLEKFKKSMSATYPIKTYKSKNSYNSSCEYCRLLIHNQKLYNDAIKQGIVEHKTNILTQPKITNENLVKDFIRGYFDGDGCVSKNTKRNTYAIKILGTEDILNYIKEFIHKNNIAQIKRYYKRKNSQTVSSLEFAGNNQTKRFLDIIYNKSTIYLDRKYKRYIELCNLLNSRTKTKVLSDKSSKLLETPNRTISSQVYK